MIYLYAHFYNFLFTETRQCGAAARSYNKGLWDGKTSEILGLSYLCHTWLTYDSQYEPASGSTHSRLTQHTVITGKFRSTNYDRHQLPTMIIKLHSTTRPTSTSSYDHPAAFYDSTDLSFQQWSSFFNDSINLRQLPATNIKLRSSTSQPYQLSTLPF